MSKENLGLSTTVVGSFPLDFTNDNMVKVFKDQIDLGIDFPCYPQLIDMVDQFLQPLSESLEELDRIGNNYILKEDFDLPDKPIALKYGKFVKNYLNEDTNFRKEIKGTKACLTGPITLSTEILLGEKISDGIIPRLFKEPRALMKKEILLKIANLMRKVGKAYDDMGFNIISMDEPILSLLIGRKPLFHEENFYLQIINTALKDISTIKSIHVCGTISPSLRDLLLNSDTNIIDHEFQTNEENFSIYKKEHLEDNNKILAMGTVKTKIKSGDSRNPIDYVETINEIKGFINKGIKLYDRENLIIKPDCGFRALKGSFSSNFAYEITVRKLENMVKAKNQILEG
ncbi:MAG: hypothetical protein EU548_05610 [Promethearchaeota archaeon]|nr:MAG: hypothetical protein EU548_05610 [Candidatus Lokiarchaeota archaeon]